MCAIFLETKFIGLIEILKIGDLRDGERSWTWRNLKAKGKVEQCWAACFLRPKGVSQEVTAPKEGVQC